MILQWVAAKLHPVRFSGCHFLPVASIIAPARASKKANLRVASRQQELIIYFGQTFGPQTLANQVSDVTSFTYPTDQRIIERLTNSIQYFQGSSGISPLRPLPPTVEQLTELMNCSFAASLETEEGRSVAFTVSFFADQECHFSYHQRTANGAFSIHRR
jgi:hypothetical protein